MDKTSICNLALSHLASSAELTNMETERTKEAKACQAFYDIAREKVLGDFPWPFATRETQLGLVTDQTADEDAEWDYAYRYPGDALRMRRIMNAYRYRNNIRATRVPFKIISDDTGKLILTDENDAIAEWTYNEEDTDKFSADFTIALSYYLAFLIAPRVTAGDQFKLGKQAQDNYMDQVVKARTNAANEQQDDELPEADMILYRD